jgi:hypothetical protein
VFWKVGLQKRKSSSFLFNIAPRGRAQEMWLLHYASIILQQQVVGVDTFLFVVREQAAAPLKSVNKS